MKEAAGEANLTVVAIILIAAVVCIATPLVGTLMRKSAQRACCTDAGGYVKDSACHYKEDNNSFDMQEWISCCTKAGGSESGSRNPCQNARAE